MGGGASSEGILTRVRNAKSIADHELQEQLASQDRRERFLQAWNEVRYFYFENGKSGSRSWEGWQSRVMALGAVLESEGLSHHLDGIAARNATETGELAFSYVIDIFKRAMAGDSEAVARMMEATLSGASVELGQPFLGAVNDALRREAMQGVYDAEWAPKAPNAEVRARTGGNEAKADAEAGETATLHGGGATKTASLKPSHSPDFTSLQWYGETYTFTERQAPAIKVLFDAWSNGTPDVGKETLLNAVDHAYPPQRVDTVFRVSGAWKTLIVSKRKGTYRLSDPSMK